MSKDRARQAILEAGQRLFLERGYASAGLEAILQTSGVPRGSFYYYFSSKEDFALQVIDAFAAHYDAIFDRSLTDPELSPLERLRALFEGRIESLETQGCRNGCPIGRLGQELADANEAFRRRLEQIFQRWEQRIADCLREAQDAGEIARDLNAAQVAEFWLSGWQGAILKARVARTTAPLRSFLDLMFGLVLRPIPPGRRTSNAAVGSKSLN